MNYGIHGRDLLLELQSTLQQDELSQSSAVLLPAYNDRLVRACLQDLQLHVQALQDQVEASTATTTTAAAASAQPPKKPSLQVRPSLMLQKAAIGRNKRCLLAYHRTRADCIAKAYWQNASDSLSTKLSPAERTFAKQYETLMQNYGLTMVGNGCDLLRYLDPPLQAVSKVQVRVVVPIGENGPIVLESGQTVNLQAVGSIHFLLFSDVQTMLREGSLELLVTEETESNPNPQGL